jgi:predicted amidohydrolase
MLTIKAALIQMDIAWEAKEANLKRATLLVREAAEKGADLAVLPEMFSTGFSMNVGELAEEEDGETHSALSALAAGCGINLIAGLQVKGGAGGKGRNAAHAYDRRGGLLSSYTKMHPFSLAGEDKHFTAGSAPAVFELEGVPVSVFICYDLRFPEEMRRVAGDVRAIFVIANWPAARASHWEALLKARAIENQCFVAGVNRVGTDGNNILYHGASALYGPTGETLCMGGDQEEVLLCDMDPDEVESVRSEFPFLKDMGR